MQKSVLRKLFAIVFVASSFLMLQPISELLPPAATLSPQVRVAPALLDTTPFQHFIIRPVALPKDGTISDVVVGAAGLLPVPDGWMEGRPGATPCEAPPKLSE